jgi:hypothetical protein
VKPVHMSHEALVALLADIHQHVADGDSFEGSIEYLMPGPFEDEKPPEMPDEEWEQGSLVTAAYRLGNLQGQGFMRMIGERGTGGPDILTLAQITQALSRRAATLRAKAGEDGTPSATALAMACEADGVDHALDTLVALLTGEG